MENSIKKIMQQRLVQLREERGWSQYDLESILFMSQKTISYIEKGNCTLTNLLQLAELYDVSLDYILGRTNEKKTNSPGLDTTNKDILAQIAMLSTAEKEKILKYLKIHNSFEAAENE